MDREPDTSTDGKLDQCVSGGSRYSGQKAWIDIFNLTGAHLWTWRPYVYHELFHEDEEDMKETIWEKNDQKGSKAYVE